MEKRQDQDHKRKNKLKFWLPVISAAIFAVLIFMYRTGYILPLWAPFYDKEGQYRAEDDRVRDYHILLEDKRLFVEEITSSRQEGAKSYAFDKGLKIEDYLVGDIDRDGKDELIVLFFKRGSYGPYRPLWVKKDERTWSQHIGIYEFGLDNGGRVNDRYLALNTGNKDGESVIRPKWVSSKIGMEITGLSLDEDMILSVRERDGTVTRWYYGDFGLILIE
ncbi:MAG: hypothetical protein K5886_06265 [Lachnospiraceae bacterium]|nr:hypothetical protein [Lachnospiraceae bacterium]